MPKRIAVLASGGGSNLQALIDYFARLGAARAGEVVLVASDRPHAGALARASAHGIAGRVLDTAARVGGRDAAVLPLLRSCAIDLVVLAGYVRFVPNDVTAAFAGRIMNVHPALLPAFGGAGMFGNRVHAAVLASGARVSGPTVHFVDAEYDHGAIIAQWPVPVRPDDLVSDLAGRVLAIEHLLYPRVVQALAAGRIRLGDDGRVDGWRPPPEAGTFVSGDPVLAARAMDQALGT